MPPDFDTGSALPSEIVWGNYRIERKLGEGGMGIVYAAIRITTNEPVALKLMKPELMANPGAADLVKRFHLETELLRSFSHPNIVSVSDAGVFENGTPYLAMERLTGGALSDHLAGYSGAINNSVRLVATVARALHTIHERSAVHRDLKPGNLMFRRDPNAADDVVITDFGLGVLVSRAARLTITGHFLGTPVYSAPEQLVDAKHVDRRADVYSLGVVLFQLISGKLPVDPPARRVDGFYIATRRTVPPRNLRDLVPGVDVDLDGICRACLHPDPTGRFESAAVLATELDNWLLEH